MPVAAIDRLREHSRHMLECAERGDWERVISLERERKPMLHELCMQATPGAGQQEAAQLIQEILDRDSRILELGTAVRNELAARLDYLRRAEGARDAYRDVVADPE